MKKLTILSIAFIAISLVSCKKDYVCSCTNTSSVSGSTSTTSEVTYVGAKKSDAKRACVKETYTTGSATTTKDCKLK